MNDRTRAVEASARVADLFAAQQGAFEAHPCPDADDRRAHLRALKKQLSRYQDVLAEAIDRDFGGRSPAESAMLDVLPTTLEINHAISHVARWVPGRDHADDTLGLVVHAQAIG